MHRDSEKVENSSFFQWGVVLQATFFGKAFFFHVLNFDREIGIYT